MKIKTTLGLSALLLSGAMSVSTLAQSAPASQPAATADSTASTAAMNPDDKSTYATGKPLEMQSKEGFWGKVNPFARKKWVARQVNPIKDRTNELDQLQAKNANDIKDVDSRAQAGISKAMNAASLADQHAQDAANRANSANTLASTASTRTDALNSTVTNLDQYQQVAATSLTFRAGSTALPASAKSDLDGLATKLANEKGYIVEVQGFSRSGVQASQAMADSVVRYLVTEHQVPVYRIYRTGMGKNTGADAADLKNGVKVTILHNSLATMSQAASAAPVAATAPAAN
ncbi:MAG: OmpA family protein [Acidobacteriota bacterium]|nr:OmpA family protein [Acidobacteriota bacterium]